MTKWDNVVFRIDTKLHHNIVARGFGDKESNYTKPFHIAIHNLMGTTDRRIRMILDVLEGELKWVSGHL